MSRKDCVIETRDDARLVRWGRRFFIEIAETPREQFTQWHVIYRCKASHIGSAVIEFRSWVAIESL